MPRPKVITIRKRTSDFQSITLIMNTLVIMTMLKCRSHDSALSEKKTGVKEENQVKHHVGWGG